MPRKSQLTVRKYQYPTARLTFSLPISYFSAIPSPNLVSLRNRLATLQVLPAKWCDRSNDDSMILCRVDIPCGHLLPVVDFSLVIESSHSWSLFYHNQKLVCPAIHNTPPLLESPADVTRILAIVESSNICTGNPDQKFLCLQQNSSTG